IANVGLVFQHFEEPLAAPQAGIGAESCHWEIGVGCRGRYPLLVEEGFNVPAAYARKRQGKAPRTTGAAFSSMTSCFSRWGASCANVRPIDGAVLTGTTGVRIVLEIGENPIEAATYYVVHVGKMTVAGGATIDNL